MQAALKRVVSSRSMHFQCMCQGSGDQSGGGEGNGN